jgi:hypothetical protein
VQSILYVSTLPLFWNLLFWNLLFWNPLFWGGTESQIKAEVAETGTLSPAEIRVKDEVVSTFELNFDIVVFQYGYLLNLFKSEFGEPTEVEIAL